MSKLTDKLKKTLQESDDEMVNAFAEGNEKDITPSGDGDKNDIGKIVKGDEEEKDNPFDAKATDGGKVPPENKGRKDLNGKGSVKEAKEDDDDDEKTVSVDTDGDGDDDVKVTTDNDDDDEDEIEEKSYKRKVKKEDLDVAEHLHAMFGNEKGLSEEFKARVEKIFSAAVLTAANKVVNETIEDMEADFREIKESHYRQLAESMDKISNMVIEDWYEQNEVQVRNQLRAELAESFIEGMKNLFAEHYIDVPDDKLDIVEALHSENSELREAVNGQMEKMLEIREELDELKKETVIKEISEDLTDTQKEKLLSLAEGIDYDDDESFIEEIVNIKKTYFTESRVVNKAIDDDNEVVLKEDVSGNGPEYSIGMKKALDFMSKW